MKFTMLIIAAAGSLAIGVFAEPKKQSADPAPASAPSLHESITLADACRITRLMNEDKWEEVEKILGTKEGQIAILRQNARIKDWPGIGGYRGTEIDKKSPLTITHRFGFGPRRSPSEIRLTYTITESSPSKPSLMFFGW